MVDLNHIDFINVIDLIPGHIYWKDVHGKYLGCNKSQAESLGLSSAKDIIGKTDYDFSDKEDADRFQRIDKKVIETRKPQLVEEFTSGKAKNTKFLTQKVPLFDENNNVIGIFGISFDITKYKNLSSYLLREKNKYELAFENILANLPGHVYWKDRNGAFLGCNQAQADSIGLTREEVIGKTVFDTLPSNEAEAINKVDMEVMRTGKACETDEYVILENGMLGTYFSKKVPLKDKNNEIIGILGISFDITDRKKLEEALKASKEQAEAANQLKTEFMRNMEHDIRTPCAGILGLADHFWREEADPTKKQGLGYIVQSAEELLDYCNTILDFEKIESGLSPIVEKKFYVDHILQKVIKIEKPAAEHKQLSLVLKHDPHIPRVVVGDSYRLYRILLNVVGNAIKFTEPRGSVVLKTELMGRKEKQIILRFKVRDTGIGIPKEQQHAIFERFTRLSPTNKGLYKGLGLGLQVVKQFMQELKGEIDLRSALGKGTEFICTIPFRLPLTEDFVEDEV